MVESDRSDRRWLRGARHRAGRDAAHIRGALVVLGLSTVPGHVQVVADERRRARGLVEQVLAVDEESSAAVEVRLELGLVRKDRTRIRVAGEPHDGPEGLHVVRWKVRVRLEVPDVELDACGRERGRIDGLDVGRVVVVVDEERVEVRSDRDRVDGRAGGNGGAGHRRRGHGGGVRGPVRGRGRHGDLHADVRGPAGRDARSRGHGCRAGRVKEADRPAGGRRRHGVTVGVEAAVRDGDGVGNARVDLAAVGLCRGRECHGVRRRDRCDERRTRRERALRRGDPHAVVDDRGDLVLDGVRDADGEVDRCAATGSHREAGPRDGPI